MDPEDDTIPARPAARDDVVFRQLDDDWVIFDPKADKLHALNLTAALVWAHLAGQLAIEEIAAEVGAAFDPPRGGAEILDDVRAAVRQFHEQGLLA